MTTDMQWLRHGKKLCLLIALVLTSCRSSKPPKIEICIGDGFGGADCVEADGVTKVYKKPSELQNYWMTSQPDMANFSSWCYQTTPAISQKGMQTIEESILR